MSVLFILPPTSDTVDVHNTFLSPQEHQWCNGCKNDAEVNSLIPKMSNNIICMTRLVY